MSDKFTWMHSEQIGAPQMSGAAGSNGQLLQVLDACLINGFNTQTATIVTKTATTVTLTFGVSHGYELLQLIALSGATDTALNGQHRVTAKTATTVTIDAAGVAVTTGTIVTKVAPLGWESIFGSTDPLKRAYRSQDIRSSRNVLYLDMNLPTGHGYNDTNPPKRAMVSICEDMTTLGVQINSYTDFENDYSTNVNGKLFWHQAHGRTKTEAVNQAKSKSWVVVGNEKVFYVFSEWRTYGSGTLPTRDFYAFGDAENLDDSFETNNNFWLGVVNTNDVLNIAYSAVGSKIGGDSSKTTDVKGYMVRGANGSGGMKPLVLSTDGTDASFISGAYGAAINATNTAFKGLLGFAVHLLTQNGLRATLPVISALPQSLLGDVTNYDKLVVGESILVSCHDSSTTLILNNSSLGFYLIDLKG